MLTPLLIPALLAASIAQQPAPDPRQTAAAQANGDRIRRAETALEQGHYAEAAELLRALALASPKDAHVLYDLGFADERTEDDNAAAKAYLAALAVDPQLPEAHTALGLLEARRNHPAEARQHLRAAASFTTAPPDLRARSLRALAVLEQSAGTPADDNAAREDLLAAIKLTGEQPSDTLLTARLAEHAGDAATAEASYRRTLASTPADPDAVAGLAHALSLRGKTGEATSLLEDALRTHPNDPRIVSQLAALYAAPAATPGAVPNGTPSTAPNAMPSPEGAARAATLLTGLRSRQPALANDPSLTRQLARLQLVSGNLPEAERLYKALVTATPGDGPLLDDLGSVYVQQARYAEAAATLRQAVELRPSFSSAADWAEAAGHLAFAASRNHDPTGSLQALIARATVLPNSAASLFLEAIAHDALHQNRDASRAYKAFLTMAGGKLPDEEFQARHRLVALEHLR